MADDPARAAGARPLRTLLDAPDNTWPDVLSSHRVPREDWTALATRGGYPTPALELDPEARETWFTGYTRAYLERDVQ